MPVRQIAGSDLQYYLVVFDEDGVERPEPDGTFLSEFVAREVAESAEPVTDVFFTSHGWKGDVLAAIQQYDAWIGAMGAIDADRTKASTRQPGFKTLVIGLHWPSLPWGDETIAKDDGSKVLSVGGDLEQDIDAYASRIASTPRARGAIRAILEAARTQTDGTRLSPRTLDAYATLFSESGLGTGNAGAPPGSDQNAFDPAAIVRDHDRAIEKAAAGDLKLLGWGDKIRDAVLSPLRQLSFWKMKDRARQFGETGGHALLAKLQLAGAKARFHLMGHSFGCIVVSATVAGPLNSRPLPRPVDSLFLVQGALSLWSFAADIPYSPKTPKTPGYFNRILQLELVRGPIVTTRSQFDTAVGRFYPLGAQLKKQRVLGGEKYPEYGGIGSFGIQGLPAVTDLVMQPVGSVYSFRSGHIYNLEASGFIKNGEGASGAHNDIAHPEVAHAFWAAILTRTDDFLGLPTMPGTSTRGRTSSTGDGFATTTTAPPAGGGLLGGGLKPSPGAPDSTRSAPPDKRWINAELEGHTKDEALVVARWYNLAIDVSVQKRLSALSSDVFPDGRLFDSGDDEVDLTVQLDSDDFDIVKPSLPLRVPRTGPSRNKASFGISPRHDGPSMLKATLHKDNNFIQQIEIRFDVGAAKPAPVETLSRGRPIAAASVLRPRDVSLTISRVAVGYECVVRASVAGRATLRLEPAFLASAIDAARDELMKVVTYHNPSGGYVFQEGLDIPKADQAAALKIMARAGARLFEKLFFGPQAAEDSKKLGEFLLRLASVRTTRLKLQIVAETAPVPWGLLYVGDAVEGAHLDWNNFLGMRHVIEQFPLQTTYATFDSEIRSDGPDLAVSVYVNSNIDKQMEADYVARQGAYWATAKKSRKRLRFTSRTKATELSEALATALNDDQILYFYCHAGTAGLADAGGPDGSALELSDGSITLGDLSLDAPTKTQLLGNPLVFINACESAQMSPAFYDGFVPYFLAKGARGVVGTECKTPALFAAEWARRFFDRFLDGEPLGEAFLALRQEFLEKHGNPLGLLYAVHCDGDTKIEPALHA